jgi:hypothetical protein
VNFEKGSSYELSILPGDRFDDMNDFAYKVGVNEIENPAAYHGFV